MARQLTGPRGVLAKAIEAARDTAAHVAGLQASVDRIADELYSARRRLEAAHKADEAEKAERIRSLVAGGGVAELTRSTGNAAAGVEEAIQACQAALGLCKSELAEAERSLGYRDLRVRSAVGEVLATEAVDRMVADVGRARDELEGRRALLKFLRPFLPADFESKVGRALAPAEAAPNSRAIAPWRAAIDALMRDAGGPLPGAGQ